MPTLSIVLCTYNRAPLLARALTALTAAASDDAELVVVDNNSTDATLDVVRQFTGGALNIRCVREPRQGLSFARNTGVNAAAGELIAFTDDDVVVDPGWIRSLRRAFEHFPDAAWIGGKVLPLWPSPPPPWLTPARWAPLALVDYGDDAFVLGPDRPLCIVGANLAVRRAALDVTGLFAAAVQRVGAGAGTTEDHELQLRLMIAGFTGAYDPSIVVHSPVERERMSKAFHRRWHSSHGRSFAAMGEADFEKTHRPIGGVAGHVVRSLAGETLAAAAALVRGRGREALEHELQARFAAGFIAERLRRPRIRPSSSVKTRPSLRSASAEPRVSVVIPCYNQAQFLGLAIESALAQTLEGVEVIVVDDGSTDDTAGVAHRYTPVTCVRQRNQGVAAARNAGLEHARGDFVIFLDADDELMPEAAATGLEALLATPGASCAAGAAVPIDVDGRPLPFITPVLQDDSARRYDELLNDNFIWTPGCVMFRRAILCRAGGFDESLSGSADYALYLTLAREWPLHWHGRSVTRYRRHAGAMSANPAAMLAQTLAVLRREWRAGAIDWRRWRRAARAWRDRYGDQIADGVRDAIRNRRWSSALTGAAALAWIHPAGAIVHLRRTIVRRLQAGVATPAVEIAAPTERASASPGSRCEKGTAIGVQTKV